MMWVVWLCRHHMAGIWQILEEADKTVGYDTIRLITISRPSAYGEYEPDMPHLYCLKNFLQVDFAENAR